MNQALENIKSINFEKIIADDAVAYLGKFVSDDWQLATGAVLKEETMFCFTRLLFHLQLARLYVEARNSGIDHFTGQLLNLVNKRLTPDRLNELTALCTLNTAKSNEGTLSGVDLSSEATNKDPGTKTAFGNFYNEFSKLFAENPDEFRMIVIKLIDLAHELMLNDMFAGLRKDILKKIVDRAFRKRHRMDLWTSSRRSLVRTFRSLVMMERLPYLITVFFAIIGFLLSYLFNEYKDLTIIKYNWNRERLMINAVPQYDYDRILALWQDDLLSEPCSHCRTQKDILVYVLKNICQIDFSKKSSFYRHEITFRNISKSYIKNISFTFKFSNDDRVIYAFARSSSMFRPDFDVPDVMPMKAGFKNINMPPGSNIILELITTTPDVPFNLSLPPDSSRIVLMKDTFLNRILDSRLNSILILIILSSCIIILNLILYARFSSKKS